MVEQRIENPRVGGSNPPLGTIGTTLSIVFTPSDRDALKLRGYRDEGTLKAPTDAAGLHFIIIHRASRIDGSTTIQS